MLLALAVAPRPVRAECSNATSVPTSSPAPDVAALDAAATGLMPDDQLEAQGAVVGEIKVVVVQIFDPNQPGERSRPYRLVNRLHRPTRCEVIERQLLFHQGQPYSRQLLEESERLLRTNRYLRAAIVRPVRYDGHQVDVEVITHDVWTLNVGFSLGRAGGENSTRLKLQDTNFLGTGKAMTLERGSNVDRSETRVSYDDPLLAGSRFQLGLSWADATDGGGWLAQLERPFFSLDTRWSAGLLAAEEDREDSLYRLGEISDRFGHRLTHFELRGGLSKGLVEGAVSRWSAGLTYQRDEFTAIAETTGELPPDRTLVYPWVGWDWQRDDFRKMENLERMGRTEDVQLGPNFHTRLGFAAPAFGADRSALIFDATASLGLARGPRHLILFDGSVGGRWAAGGLENALAQIDARYHWRNFEHGQLFVGLEAGLADNLDPDQQLLLGGDSGLRGYPLRYQAGTSRWLLTLEQRVYTDWYPLRVVRVGAAAFYDVGRVGGGASDASLGRLQDAGVGLRLVPTRTGRSLVVHLDVAFPLDGPDDLRGVQWLIKTRSTF